MPAVKTTPSLRKLRPAIVTAIALIAGLATGQGADVGYKPLRYDEDFSVLRDPSKRDDPLDGLKFIPLSSAADDWLTFGGEGRLRYEYYRHSLWGQGPQDDNGYWLERLMLHADLHLGESLRLFTQVKSGWEDGRVGGPRPTDEDRLDLNQAFLDVSLPSTRGEALTLRVGRQELSFGSSRLISFRESPNVRLAFDGVRAIWQTGTWRVDALAVEPVQTRAGTFDDGRDRHQKLWGIYAVTPFSVLPGAHVDIYYLGLKRDAARFDQGTAREERQTIGSRVWGKAAGWDYNFEFVYQFGTFGPASIAAWSVASDTGYTFAAAPLQPRLSLKADIVSGDRDRNDGTLNTFNALFPRGAYFNESALIGPANLIDLHPGLELKPAWNVVVSVDCDFFWRESQRDGIYGPPGNLLRSGRNTDRRYLGQQPSLHANWRAGRHWNLDVTYARFFAAKAIGETGPGRDVDYFAATATYRF